MSRDLMTLQEIADEVGVHVNTVRRWIKSGGLPCLQNGRVVRIHRDDWEAYVASWRTGGAVQKSHVEVPAVTPGQRLRWGGIHCAA